MSQSPLHRQELIELCQRLVRTPSVNGVDTERSVAEQVASFAHQHGLQVDMPAKEPERPNVLVRMGPQDIPGLLLIAHMDTVPVGAEVDWRYPPFSGVVEGGRLYGRGSADNKGGLVAGLAALLSLKPNEKELKRPLTLVCVPDEESGATGRLGICYLYEKDLLHGLGAIYTYSGKQRIIIGHRGVLRLQLTAHGRAFHTGSKEWQTLGQGYNAIAGMAELLAEIEHLDLRQVYGQGLFAPYRTTITPTMISGGTGLGIAPDTCQVTIDIRLIPDTPQDKIEQAIQELVDQIEQRRSPLNIQVQTQVSIPPAIIPEDAPVVLALKHAAKQELGIDLPLQVSGPANESYLLNGFGIPTCVYGPQGGQAHAADEYVEIEAIFSTAAIYASTLLALVNQGA